MKRHFPTFVLIYILSYLISQTSAEHHVASGLAPGVLELRGL